MIIDNTPGIRAFCQERIRQINSLQPLPGNAVLEARLDELQMIVTLCDGLTKQNEFLTKAMSAVLPASERI